MLTVPDDPPTTSYVYLPCRTKNVKFNSSVAVLFFIGIAINWRALPYRRANLDGSGQLTLVTGQFGASGIALDLEGGQMYWTTDGLGHSIRRANLNGTAQETLVTALSNPLGIALQIGVTPIPEPSTLTLLSIGALGLFAYAGRIKPRFRQGIIQSARSLGRSTPQVLYS